MERYRNLNQAYLKWWKQFSRRSYELLALILTKLSSLWRASAFLHAARFLGIHGLRLHTFECNTLWPFAPILHPESPWGVYCGLLVLGDCKYSCQLRLWPCYFPALCHCCLVSQHGTGIWNCFARKVAAYQLMLAAMLNLVNGTLPKLEPSLPEMMRAVFTTVLWAFGFDSYQTQLTLTGIIGFVFFVKWRDFFWFVFSFVDVTLMCLCLHIWDETLTSSTFRTVSCELAIPVGVLHHGYPQLSFVHTNRAMVGFWGARQNWPWKSRRVMAMAMTEWSKVFNTAQCHGDP